MFAAKTASVAPLAASTPPRKDIAEMLRNAPFPTAEDDAADAAAAEAARAARLQQILDRPAAPRDHTLLRILAWERHCQGVSVRDIADEFSIPERTVRSWLAAQRDELSADLAELRQTHLLLAVDSLRRLLATAWELLEVERDATLHELEAIAASPDSHPAANRPRHSHAPRYLNNILSIQKELNRILALSIDTVAPTKTENPAETATASSIPQTENPAETAETATTPNSDSKSAQADFAAKGPPGAVSTAGPTAIPTDSTDRNILDTAAPIPTDSTDRNILDTVAPTPTRPADRNILDARAHPANPAKTATRSVPHERGLAGGEALNLSPSLSTIPSPHGPFPPRREGGRGLGSLPSPAREGAVGG